MTPIPHIGAPVRVQALVIGGGPAGLMAAQALAEAGRPPLLLDACPTFGRKLLMAGKSGLNLTKSEPASRFRAAYGAAPDALARALDDFGPEQVRAWAESLGVEVFAGSSGRVFPREMKASPLLRAWLARLVAMGVEFRTRWRWSGWRGDAFLFEAPGGPCALAPEVAVLALGGASWPRLGATGAWTGLLAERGVEPAPFRPANMGFDVAWSAHFRDRFAGAPVKGAALSFAGRRTRGDFVISGYGVEGGAVYALCAPLRDALETGPAALTLDLAPDRRETDLARALARPRGKASMANHLRKAARLAPVKAALLRECAPQAFDNPEDLAAAIKALPLPLLRPRPVAEAISVAGGLRFADLDADLMLRRMPGLFGAGEMLDWEAPTGGYLITACLATGRMAGRGAARRLGAGP